MAQGGNTRTKKGRQQPFRRMPRALVVLDTNVILDTHSCHDLLTKLDELVPSLGDAALDDQAVTFRLERAREAMLLAIYLHKIGATTFSLHNEVLEKLARFSPPGALATSFTTAFTTVFIHFVKDFVLGRWNTTMPTQPGTERGNGADRALVAAALERSVPLVSTEGYSHTGEIDEGKLIRRLAGQQGVEVCLPREVYAGKMNEGIEIEAFLHRFADNVPKYVRDHHRRFGEDGSADVLTTIFGIYRLVLKGEAADRDNVRVSLAAHAQRSQ